MDFIKNLNRSIFFIVAIVLFVIRLAGDSLLFIIDYWDGYGVIIWKLLSSALLLLSLGLYFFKDFIYKYDVEIERSIDEYFQELTKVLIYSVILVFLYIIPNTLGIRTHNPDNILVVALSDFISIYCIFTSLYLIKFIYYWLQIRRHKRTNLYLNILRNGLYYFIIVEFLIHTFDFLNNSIVEIFSYLMMSFLLIVALLVTKKNSWIVLLPKSKKLNLLWQTGFGIIFCVIIGSSAYFRGTLLHKSLIHFMPGTASIVGVSFLLAGVYFLRLFISIIGALPTSRIVERRTSEILSLTHLNRLVAEAIDFDKLLENVTNLSLQSIGGIAAWIELYDIPKLELGNKKIFDKGGKRKVTINAVKDILEEQIAELDKDDILGNIFRNLEKPLLIDSIADNKLISELDWKIIPEARSMIAVPLNAGDERIGTLVVINSEEYGYEQDDVKVLSAFSDNVSVAIVNGRLLEDSIDKERLKRELLLAREMEEKLLPQHLPMIKNYEISAFTIPADEVGGDYYDMVKLKDGRTCILIGDVSGKGMTAAFYMAQLKGVVLAVANESEGASDILKRINYTLFGAIDKQMYITLCAVVIENDSGKITIARAGHMPIIIKNRVSNNPLTPFDKGERGNNPINPIDNGDRSNNPINPIDNGDRSNNPINPIDNGDRSNNPFDKVEVKVSVIIPKGIGVGLANNEIFEKNLEEEEVLLTEGGFCLLYTDGISELKNRDNLEFGLDSLKQILDSRVYQGVDRLVLDIKERLKKHSEEVKAHDDMTIVVISYQKS